MGVRLFHTGRIANLRLDYHRDHEVITDGLAGNEGNSSCEKLGKSQFCIGKYILHNIWKYQLPRFTHELFPAAFVSV